MTRDELLAMADRDLDAMVAEKVMGWRRKFVPEGYWWLEHAPTDKDWEGRDFTTPFSTDIAAAWSVVPELLKRGRKVTIEDGTTTPARIDRTSMAKTGQQGREHGLCVWEVRRHNHRSEQGRISP